RGYTVKAGQRVRTGWRRIVDLLALPFSNRLRAGMLRMATLTTATIAAASWFALTGGMPDAYRWWALGGIAAATIAGLAYGWVIAQRVVQPLEGAARIARQIAAGNLLIDIDADQRGEVGNLYFYLDMMRKS